ncbi:MAG: sensor histidine kinase, partial [Chloroflexota bacterium]
SSYPGQRIDLVGSADLPACADLERMVQILVNVLDNAAKYSPEGSPIAVAWAREGREAVVRVRDRGSGIPPLGREQLFSRFGRMPGSRTRAGRVGTGLGLHLGRQIAEAMGGSLELEETSPSGSIFRLRVPLASA